MNTVWEDDQSFVHEAVANRVVFGMAAARADLLAELTRLTASRVIVIGVNKLLPTAESFTVSWRDRLVGSFGPDADRQWDDNIADGLVRIQALKPDCIVALGGGTVISIARIIGAKAEVPVICLPTTYSGSELHRLSQAPSLPDAIIYDPQLTVTLPEESTVATAMYALARGIQACVSRLASPVSLLVALEGIRALADGLPDTVLDPEGLSGRSRTLYGSYMTGSAHTFAGSGLQDRVCAVLATEFSVPYIQSQSVLVPHIAFLNSRIMPQIMAQIADALGVDDAAVGLFKLAREVGAPGSLADIGLLRADVDAAAAACWRSLAEETREGISESELHQLIEGAWQGRLPDTPYNVSIQVSF
ncbi:iron-containing alcohol dehydrogenase [Salinisphaera sp.]|uniref:iron-containing alcohol dehydrogenase n=1 Tax=Salinisphaera sp. TaxID=1914330 RepID=UPI002D79CBC7|nr:iron-containing alcohol dehydrogenase [Salinisphaera sp.]HET7315767.1 iron-containing alcohol dehydrogenase [Salinisphaera sp.]